MSEVEKLYKNARVSCKPNYVYNKAPILSGLEYPPFTTKKQLSLIKWLSETKNGFGLFKEGAKYLSCHCVFDCEWFNKNFYAEDFDNALAGLINSLWQDLTEEEKQEIKRILECHTLK